MVKTILAAAALALCPVASHAELETSRAPATSGDTALTSEEKEKLKKELEEFEKEFEEWTKGAAARQAKFDALIKLSEEIRRRPGSSIELLRAGNKLWYELEIQAAGYNCPEVKTIVRLPEDAYGTPWKVVCGPVGEDTINTALTFRATVRPRGGVLIQPAPPRG